MSQDGDLYNGTVKSFDPAVHDEETGITAPCYKIVYDDSDKEDILYEELLEMIQLYKDEKDKLKAEKKRKGR